MIDPLLLFGGIALVVVGAASLYERRALWLLRNHRFAEARVIYHHLLNILPRSPILHMNLSWSYFMEDSMDRALKLVDKAIELGPKLPAPYNNRGWILAVNGDLDASLADIQHALELNPKYVSALDSEGHTLFLMGEFDEALASYSEALNIQPNHISSLAGQAVCYHAIGKTGEAYRIWRRVVEQEPRYQHVDEMAKDFRPAAGFIEAARKIAAEI